MPNVLLEAGALGVPSVASTAGGMADLLTGGENGLTFPPGDVHECRRALVELAGMPLEALRRMGERLRATILRDFHHEAEASRYVKLLTETAGRTLRPATANAHTES
ncbi:MAG: glycosyltransferase family 4 protein [Holophagales bacterium]|nr:glycosyltransferase family 4 protein [Holophagales bacterium]